MTTAALITAIAACGFCVFAVYLTHQNVNHTLERLHMSTQAAIDAIVAQLTKAKDELAGKLEEATLGVQAQLVEAGVAEQVDLSALAGIAQALDDLVPDTDNAAAEEPVEVDETDETDEVEVEETDEVEVDTETDTDDEDQDDNGELVDLTNEDDDTK